MLLKGSRKSLGSRSLVNGSVLRVCFNRFFRKLNNRICVYIISVCKTLKFKLVVAKTDFVNRSTVNTLCVSFFRFECRSAYRSPAVLALRRTYAAIELRVICCFVRNPCAPAFAPLVDAAAGEVEERLSLCNIVNCSTLIGVLILERKCILSAYIELIGGFEICTLG